MIPYECEITDEDQLKEVLKTIGDQYDGIDLLVNNANVMVKGFILQDKNFADMHEIMDTNLLALCIVTREGVKLMRQRIIERKDVGHIININSIFGHKVQTCVVMNIF